MKTDIEAEPKTAGEIEADAETARAARNPDPGATRLLARRAMRQSEILKFKGKQKQGRRWVSLHAVIGWLAGLNGDGLRGPIDDASALLYAAELRDALCDGAFARPVAGKSLPQVFMLSDDLPPCCFGAEDIDAVRQTKMYDDPRAARALLARLWVPRDLLLKLFQQKKWPQPFGSRRQGKRLGNIYW